MKLPDFLTGHVTPDAFARRMLRAFATRGFADARYDAQQFAIDLGAGEEAGVMYLSNFYADFCRAPRWGRSRLPADMVQSRIQGMADAKNMAPSVDRLMPVIRDRSHAWFCRAQIQVQFKDGQLHVSDRLIGDDHRAYLVLDSPTQTQQVDDGVLKTLDIGFDDAMARAIQNLRDASPDKWHALGHSAFAGAWDDTFDCSRILLPDLIYRLNLSGNPVALIPARGVLLVTSSNSVAGQLTILFAAKNLMEENSRWISAHMLELVNGQWQPYTPTAPDVLAMQNDINTRMLASNYGQQKDLLEGQLKRQGRDIFVATYMAYQKESGAFSVATWTQGVEAWLPKTHFIMFVKPGAKDKHDVVTVTWDTAFACLQALMEVVPDVLPVRFQVRDFPDAATLEVLRGQQATLG